MAFETLEDEGTRLAALAASSLRVQVDVVGQSVQGRDIRLVRIGSPPPAITDRPAILYIGLQHGNEPAGREALLDLADYLSTTADSGEVDLLEQHGVMIMPTMNPDGFLVDDRENANGVDLNRDHITLGQPEIRALATVLGQARPYLVLDHHEGPGGLADDLEFLDPTNVQVDAELVTRSREVITRMVARAGDEGWTVDDFNGTPEERILRSCAGLRGSCSVLVETDGDDDTDPGQALRTERQRACAEEALAYMVEHVTDVITSVDAAEARKIAEGADGTQSFDLRNGNVLNPPPLAYQLTATQQSATTFHRTVFNVDMSDDLALMGQAAQPIIPFLFDVDAEYAVIAATRLFTLPGEPPPPGPAPVATAQVRTRVTWLACDLASGQVIDELPDLTGQVSRLVGQYRSASLTLPIPLSGPAHRPIITVEQATRPAEVMLVAIVNDLPAWAGIPLPRQGGTAAELQIGCVTPEGYLQHRFVRDHEWTQQDEAAVIAAGLLADAGAISGVGPGIAMIIDAPATGRLRDREYLASDHKSVYDALVELMGVESGPEWTIDLDWIDADHTAVQLIARVRSRLGVVAAQPQAVFQASAGSVFSSAGSSEATYTYVEDFSGDRYGNYVVAYSSGEGEDQPVSTPAIDQAALDGGAPIWERHWQPSTSITGVSVLDEHARAELARIRNGFRAFQLEARWDAYPRYGVDWALGDDIGWELQGHRHPDGVLGQGRAVGWELDIAAGLIRPILQEGT